jgi:inosine-uridine nucleoside N-ribohydrolase
MKIHLDTDLGGDIDDLCALAMLLQLPDAEIVGITTAAEEDGKRAGYVRRALRLAGREEIPVAAGANSHLKHHYYDEQAYWGEAVAPSPNPVDDALALLKQSIEQGAAVACIAPLKNLALLEKKHPGILETAKLFLMGGYVFPPREGFPQWTFKDDYNIQLDAEASRYVLAHSNPTLITLASTVETALRRKHLEKLKSAGALAALIARQTEAFAADEQMEQKFGAVYENVPDDIINFLHDPLACAVAVGFRDGVEISNIPLKFELTDGFVQTTIDADGKLTPVVTSIDGNRFGEFWIETVARHSGV